MHLTIASKGGFCFGVKKAVDTAIKASEERQDKKYLLMDLLFIILM